MHGGAVNPHDVAEFRPLQCGSGTSEIMTSTSQSRPAKLTVLASTRLTQLSRVLPRSHTLHHSPFDYHPNTLSSILLATRPS